MNCSQSMWPSRRLIFFTLLNTAGLFLRNDWKFKNKVNFMVQPYENWSLCSNYSEKMENVVFFLLVFFSSSAAFRLWSLYAKLCTASLLNESVMRLASCCCCCCCWLAGSAWVRWGSSIFDWLLLTEEIFELVLELVEIKLCESVVCITLSVEVARLLLLLSQLWLSVRLSPLVVRLMKLSLVGLVTTRSSG